MSFFHENLSSGFKEKDIITEQVQCVLQAVFRIALYSQDYERTHHMFCCMFIEILLCGAYL